jgi:hypothetical protein
MTPITNERHCVRSVSQPSRHAPSGSEITGMSLGLLTPAVKPILTWLEARSGRSQARNQPTQVDSGMRRACVT